MPYVNLAGHDFDLLVTPLRADLLKHVRHLCRNNSADAEDIVQDSLMSAFEAWDDWPTAGLPSHADPVRGAKSWMFQIASNKFVSRVRLATHRARALQEWPLDLAQGVNVFDRMTNVKSGTMRPPATPNRLIKSHENVDLSPPVQQAVDRLSPDRRAIVECYYLRDNSTLEVSEKLGIPHSTVRTKLVRTHNRLRPLLARFARDEYNLRGTRVEALAETSKVSEADPQTEINHT